MNRNSQFLNRDSEIEKCGSQIENCGSEIENCGSEIGNCGSIFERTIASYLRFGCHLKKRARLICFSFAGPGDSWGSGVTENGSYLIFVKFSYIQEHPAGVSYLPLTPGGERPAH